MTDELWNHHPDSRVSTALEAKELAEAHRMQDEGQRRPSPLRDENRKGHTAAEHSATQQTNVAEAPPGELLYSPSAPLSKRS